MAEATIEETGEAEAEPTTRSQMEKHQGFVDWYAEEGGGDLGELSPAEIIAEFARLRNEFRRSDFYLERWGPEARARAAAERAEAQEQARAEREAERQRKAAKRAAEKEAKEKARAEAAANGEGDEKPKAKPTRKRVAKKASASTIVVDETDNGDEASEDEVFE